MKIVLKQRLNNKYTGDFGVYDKTTINNSNNTINAELKNINGQ